MSISNNFKINPLNPIFSSLKHVEKKTWAISLLATAVISFGIITLLAVNHRIDCHVLSALGNYGGGGCIGGGVLSLLLAISREYRLQNADFTLSENTSDMELEVVWKCSKPKNGAEILKKYQSKIEGLVQEVASSMRGQEPRDHHFLIRTEEQYNLFLTVCPDQISLEISQNYQWNFYDQILIANVTIEDDFKGFLNRHEAVFNQAVFLLGKKNWPSSYRSHQYAAIQIEDKVVVLKEEENGLKTAWLYERDDSSYLEHLDDLSHFGTLQFYAC